MGTPLKADLNYVLQMSGSLNGLTLREAIDKDVLAINGLHQQGRIKLDADALCYLINARSTKESHLGRFAARARERS